MQRYRTVDKKLGETPLAAIERFRKEHPSFAHVRASYAGRLDPMATGKLLILLGDECRRLKEYTGLDKEYEIEVLLDVASDTGDALGVVDYAGKETRVDARSLSAVLTAERGRHAREYPAYSSKTVHGKPLFMYALEGALGSIEIPQHEEHIYAVTLLDTALIATEELEERLNDFLLHAPKTDEPSKALGADFRIDAVRASWKRLFVEAKARRFALLRLRVACGSGTYMRTLAGRIGNALGTAALALSIRRTRIGRRFAGFWIHSY